MRIFTLFFVCFIPKIAYPFWTLLGVIVAVPVLNGIVGSKTVKAEATLSNVNQTVFYVNWFLFLVAALVFLGVVLWIVKAIRRERQRRLFRQVVSLLASVQSDISVLNGGTVVCDGQAQLMAESKKEMVKELIKLLDDKFFAKKLDDHVLKRMIGSLELVRDESVGYDNQLVFVDQWMRKLSLVRV
jgi:mRNA-degrading endonuclease YafQ of YafQ-DinJ toxin-antitoxin module